MTTRSIKLRSLASLGMTRVVTKIIVGSLFSLSASAGTQGSIPTITPNLQDVEETIFGGIYAGVMGGGENFDSKTELNRVATFPLVFSSNSILSDTQTNKNYQNNAIGAIYLGYGCFIQNGPFYLGGELFADYANRSIETANNAYIQANSTNNAPVFQDAVSLNSAVTTKLNSAEFAIDFKPGYLFDTSALIYGRVGIGFNKATLSTNDEFSFISIPTPALNTSIFSSESISDNQATLRLGVGIEKSLGNYFSVTVDYIYTRYGSIAINSVGPTVGQAASGALVTNPNGLVKSTSSTLNTNSIMVGFKRYFTFGEPLSGYLSR